MNAGMIAAMIRAAQRANTEAGWKSVRPFLAMDSDVAICPVRDDEPEAPQEFAVTLLDMENAGLAYFAETGEPFTSLDLAAVMGCNYSAVYRRLAMSRRLHAVGNRMAKSGHAITLWAPRGAYHGSSGSSA